MKVIDFGFKTYVNLFERRVGSCRLTDLNTSFKLNCSDNIGSS